MGKETIIFEVVKIEWERIFLSLYIKTNYKGKVKFRMESLGKIFRDEDDQSIVGMKIKDRMPIKYKKKEDGVYHFRFNIAAIRGRQFLENGRWRIMAATKEGNFVCYASHEVAYDYDKHSRIFRYGGGKYAYNISFSSLMEEEKYLWFYINTYFMIKNDHWKIRRYVQEALTVLGKFNRMYMYTAITLMRLFYLFWSHVFPKRGKNVLLMSETKDYLWGNLKAIDDRLHDRGLDKKFNISYSFRKAVGTHMSALSWAKLIFMIAKQDYIFVDDYVPVFGFLNLRKKTKLIQVWHAGVGFKSVGYSRFGKVGTPFPSGSCHKKYDYVLVGSEELVEVYSEVFGIEEEAFLPVGMPRLDGFLDEGRISSFREEFYQTYPKLKGKKLILFAPTFRGGGQKFAHYNYEWLDLKKVYDFCGDEYIFLVKMHPFVHQPIHIPGKYKDRIIDFASYPNINDLYYVTDILITDYSSNYFEYSLMKRPVLFYTPDRELYELSRGVHRSVRESAPGKVCDTFDELMEALENKDYEIEKIYQFVKDNFNNYDGHAADKAIDKILLGRKR
ncbi:MAG: teichoic acid biosynthesis protein [Dorea sp.]|nr:teichoic acid biosynthesis protein [Dorea sp.]